MIIEKISEILDLPIRPGRWVSYTNALNIEGKPDKFTLTRMVMTMCEVIEVLENEIDNLKVKSEPVTSIEAPKTAVSIKIDPMVGSDDEVSAKLAKREQFLARMKAGREAKKNATLTNPS